jgi:hypothetical protein
VANARVKAGRAHIRVFGFHASTGDIATNPNFEYLREGVVTNDGRNVAIYERACNLFNLAHDFVQKPKRSLERSAMRTRYWFKATRRKSSHSNELHCSIAASQDATKTMAEPSLMPTRENQDAFSSRSSVAIVLG